MSHEIISTEVREMLNEQRRRDNAINKIKEDIMKRDFFEVLFDIIDDRVAYKRKITS